MPHQVIDFLLVFEDLLSSVPYFLVHQRSLQAALFTLFHFHEPCIILVHSSNVFPWVFSGLFLVADLSQSWHKAVVVHFQERFVFYLWFVDCIVDFNIVQDLIPFILFNLLNAQDFFQCIYLEVPWSLAGLFRYPHTHETLDLSVNRWVLIFEQFFPFLFAHLSYDVNFMNSFNHDHRHCIGKVFVATLSQFLSFWAYCVDFFEILTKHFDSLNLDFLWVNGHFDLSLILVNHIFDSLFFLFSQLFVDFVLWCFPSKIIFFNDHSP
jgi:hypothetical protein